MRPIVAVLGVIVVVLVSWTLLRPKDDSSTERRASLTTQERDSDPHSGVDEIVGKVTQPPTRSEVLATPQSGSPERAAGGTPPSGALRIQGRFIVTDESGREYTETNGLFARVFYDPERTGVQVAVEAGHFTLDLPRGEALEIGKLKLDDRPVVLEHHWFAFSDVADLLEPLVLRGRWPKQTTLRVLDAGSGADLSSITVLRRSNRTGEDGVLYPGDPDQHVLLVEDASSPFPVAGQQGAWWNISVLTVLVGSPDHAWATARLNFAEGGEHVVELAPGGSLELHLHGDLSALEGSSNSEGPTQVCIREASGDESEIPNLEEFLSEAAEEPLNLPGRGEPSPEELRILHGHVVDWARGPVVLLDQVGTRRPMTWTGLAAGSFVVSIEHGRSLAVPSTLGSAVFEIEAGRTTRVDLELASTSEGPQKVPLSGTLFVPPEWNLSPPELSFSRHGVLVGYGIEGFRIDLQDMQPVTGSPGLYTWDAGRVTPGPYQVHYFSLQYREVIETGAAGRSDVELALAPPADLILHLVDDRTGKPAPGLDVCWGFRRTEDGRAPGTTRADWDASIQAYRIRAPAAPIEVTLLFEESYGMTEACCIALQPGLNEHTHEVHAVSGVEITLFDAGRTLRFPWGGMMWARVRCLSGGGRGWPCLGGETSGLITVTEPGRYEIDLKLVSGFQPIAPFVIQIPDGEILQHALVLTKE